MQDDETHRPMEFPEVVFKERVGYLPPMSGLAAEEDKLEMGSINVRIGEGRTAEVLRNLCYIVWSEDMNKWKQLVLDMKRFFSIDLNEPKYDPVTGRISMTYCESDNIQMDLSNAGR